MLFLVEVFDDELPVEVCSEAGTVLDREVLEQLGPGLVGRFGSRINLEVGFSSPQYEAVGLGGVVLDVLAPHFNQTDVSQVFERFLVTRQATFSIFSYTSFEPEVIENFPSWLMVVLFEFREKSPELRNCRSFKIIPPESSSQNCSSLFVRTKSISLNIHTSISYV